MLALQSKIWFSDDMVDFAPVPVQSGNSEETGIQGIWIPCPQQSYCRPCTVHLFWWGVIKFLICFNIMQTLAQSSLVSRRRLSTSYVELGFQLQALHVPMKRGVWKGGRLTCHLSLLPNEMDWSANFTQTDWLRTADKKKCVADLIQEEDFVWIITKQQKKKSRKKTLKESWILSEN